MNKDLKFMLGSLNHNDFSNNTRLELNSHKISGEHIVALEDRFGCEAYIAYNEKTIRDGTQLITITDFVDVNEYGSYKGNPNSYKYRVLLFTYVMFNCRSNAIVRAHSELDESVKEFMKKFIFKNDRDREGTLQLTWINDDNGIRLLESFKIDNYPIRDSDKPLDLLMKVYPYSS